MKKIVLAACCQWYCIIFVIIIYLNYANVSGGSTSLRPVNVKRTQIDMFVMPIIPNRFATSGKKYLQSDYDFCPNKNSNALNIQTFDHWALSSTGLFFGDYFQKSPKSFTFDSRWQQLSKFRLSSNPQPSWPNWWNLNLSVASTIPNSKSKICFINLATFEGGNHWDQYFCILLPYVLMNKLKCLKLKKKLCM